MTTDRLPIVDATASKDGRLLTFECEGCGRTHTHGRCCAGAENGCRARENRGASCTCPVGTGDGHRSAHCIEKSSRFKATGYVLKEVTR